MPVGRTAAAGRVRAADVAGAVLAALCVLVALALLGPGGCVALTLLAVGAAILFHRTAQHRARITTVESGAQARGGPRVAASHDPVRQTISATDAALPVACTDEELCWAWRRSFARLVHATELEAVALLAEQRRGYLDELERRHPARFATWISSGARAAGDPTPYFRPHRTS